MTNPENTPRRRKPPKKRVLTVQQLHARLARSWKSTLIRYATLTGGYYGGLRVTQSSAYMKGSVLVEYDGKWMEDAGINPMPICCVSEAADGSSVYLVFQIPPVRRNDPARRKLRAMWRKAVLSHTPHDGSPFGGKRHLFYLWKDGQATRLEKRPGVWSEPPHPSEDVEPAEWVKHVTESLPVFAKRARLFVPRLRKALRNGPPCRVSLVPHHASDRGPVLFVHSAPSATADGRWLRVALKTHDLESRTFHHVDGDYGMKHCQVVAEEFVRPRYHRPDLTLRWKCLKDAIVGIQEWIMGTIHIPGPG